VITGALVAKWLSSDETEIHHVTVRMDFQKKVVGRMLIEEIFRLVQDNTPLTIKVCAQSKSYRIFLKPGFKPVSNRLEVDGFI